MKTFKKDLSELLERLRTRKPFAFSKYADGEYKILRNEQITNCDLWTFLPDTHKEEQQLLMKSFQYASPDYIVGISCPCCQPEDHVQWMRENCKTKNVTWANLFVNSNYDFFLQEFIKEFQSWENDVFLFANEEGVSKKLPFNVTEYFPINMKAWQEPFLSHWINIAKDRATNCDGKLFLFCGGPLGNILAYELHKHNPLNTYIDIGSTLNPWIVGSNRDYHKGASFRKQTCIW